MLNAAGLWEPRHSLQPEDENGTSTVITHDAVDAAGEVDDRMPIFLPARLAHEWMQIMLSAPESAIELRRVSRRVNSSRNAGDQQMLDAID